MADDTARTQGPKYVMVAVASAGADWLCFLALSWAGLSPLASQAVARVVGGITSFVSNKVWTYDAGDSAQGRAELVRFGVLYAASYALSLGLLASWTAGIGRGFEVGKLLADTACFLFNFFVMRVWVFRDAGAGVEDPVVGSPR